MSVSNVLHKCALGAAFALLLAISANAQQSRVADVAERVDRYYNSLQSLQAEFAESYRGGGLERAEGGTLWLKQPGKMRWEYRLPAEKLFVSDGKTAWFYLPGERQARKAPVKKLDDLRTPLRYLLGHTKLVKEFNGLSFAPDVKASDSGNVILRGVPKGMEDRVSQVVLEIAPGGQIVRIVLDDADGSTTEFRFSNLQPNLPLADARFHFTPPLGVEVVEASDLAP